VSSFRTHAHTVAACLAVGLVNLLKITQTVLTAVF